MLEYWIINNPDKSLEECKELHRQYGKAKRKSAEEIWIYDKQKIECAERNGYKVHVLWEHDWILDPDKELEKCIEFLNE